MPTFAGVHNKKARTPKLGRARDKTNDLLGAHLEIIATRPRPVTICEK